MENKTPISSVQRGVIPCDWSEHNNDDSGGMGKWESATLTNIGVKLAPLSTPLEQFVIDIQDF